MKKILIALFTAFIMAATIAPAHASVVHKNGKVVENTVVSYYGGADKRKAVRLGVNVLFRQTTARNNSQRWIKPDIVIARYDAQGERMKCGLFKNFPTIKADFKFFDQGGRLFDPPGFKIACSQDTVGYRFQNYNYNTTPRLWFDGDTAPRWRAEFIIADFPHGNQKVVLGGKFPKL